MGPRFFNLQESQDGGLLGRRSPQLFFGPLLESFDQRAVEVGVDYGGMNVALPPDGFCIAETRGDALDRFSNVAFRRSFGIEVFEPAHGLSRQGRPRPSAKIPGCEVLARDLPQILVYVGGADVAGLARIGGSSGECPPGRRFIAALVLRCVPHYLN